MKYTAEKIQYESISKGSFILLQTQHFSSTRTRTSHLSWFISVVTEIMVSRDLAKWKDMLGLELEETRERQNLNCKTIRNSAVFNCSHIHTYTYIHTQTDIDTNTCTHTRRTNIDIWMSKEETDECCHCCLCVCIVMMIYDKIFHIVVETISILYGTRNVLQKKW